MNKKFILTILLLSLSILSFNYSYAEEVPVPTLKGIAEKQEADEAALKKIAEAPFLGPYGEFSRVTLRSSLIALTQAVRTEDYDINISAGAKLVIPAKTTYLNNSANNAAT
ncbi:hypothetical protein MNBD_GAMMA05-1949 [hydrothermal vent metagenome]|uniref:Uncharacterized protein n=1 Tax=hydrothermal vent metagenome TaxID=652676 RepID=A0A3B0WPQ8_9ZZZZ